MGAWALLELTDALLLRNAMQCVCTDAAELIFSTGVNFGFSTFKPMFCVYNKLRLYAEILSKRVNDVQPFEV